MVAHTTQLNTFMAYLVCMRLEVNVQNFLNFVEYFHFSPRLVKIYVYLNKQ